MKPYSPISGGRHLAVEVIALVGPAGTGKSHRAIVVAQQCGADLIVDDGLLIRGDRILAGISAKRQPTRLAAIKTALFTDPEHAAEVRAALEAQSPERILILGTSPGMVRRIAERLGLPAPQKIITIDEVSSPKEMRKARYLRLHHGKHVIPASTMEVRRTFPNTLIDSLKVFLRKHPAPAAKTWVEQSVVRPTYSEYGNLTIAEAALHALVAHAARVPGVASPGRIGTEAHGGTVVVHLEPVLYYGNNLHHVSRVLQRQIKRQLEELTGMSVAAVNVLVRRVIPPPQPAEAGRHRSPSAEGREAAKSQG